MQLDMSQIWAPNLLGTFKQGVSKQGVMTFAWRPGWQYDVAATRGADSALASDCRAQFGLPSTRRGCRICVTVRLPVRPRGETMYWQANANTPLSVTPLLNVPEPGLRFRCLESCSRFTTIGIATGLQRFQIAQFKPQGQKPFESLLRLYSFSLLI